MDAVMAIVMLVMVLEATRRYVGLPLAIIAVVFVLYALFGRYMPPILVHRGFSLERVTSFLYIGTSGYYGLPVATMFRYVVIFVIFGKFLEKTGASDFLLDLARAIAGRFTGGVGHVALVSSAFMGSISGSAVANVATTGPITIPAMKRTGFKPRMAGAIEAVASNGGQILPPVMGAAAFLMADFLQISYGTVALAALVPALLYYFSVGLNIYVYASKHGIKGLPKSELPSIKKVLAEGWYFIIPFVLLIWLLSSGKTATFSGLLALLAVMVIGFLKPKNRLTIKDLFVGLKESGESVVMLIMASAAAGIVVGVLSLTGLGNRMSAVLITLSGDQVLVLLILTMIVSVILGMGMPTTVIYIMLATLVAPALIEMNILNLSAHLFILYFGTMSMLTPPVALASYTGASIAGADPNETSYDAIKIAIPCYIVPFYFIFNDALLLQSNNIGETIWSIFIAVVGIVALTLSMTGHFKNDFNVVQRIILAAVMLMFIHPSIYTDIAGLILVAIVFIMQRFRAKEMQTTVNSQ
jgi:TRAP transporter 4TM/12TM fusion protein